MESNDTKTHQPRLSRFIWNKIIDREATGLRVIDFSKIGMLFFALATIAFGIQNFIYGDFIMGRAPVWPETLGGQSFWVYASGAILFLFGGGIVVGRNSLAMAIGIALLVFIWALVRHILLGHWNWGTEITQTGKALTFFGGALCVAGIIQYRYCQSSKLSFWLILIGRVCLGGFFIICGIEHFMFIDFVKSLVPAWIPGNVFWTYLTGIALIAGGVGMMIKRTMKLAAFLSGAMVFIWFIILHIPRAIMGNGDGNEWIAVFEALAVSGIAFMIYGSQTSKDNLVF